MRLDEVERNVEILERRLKKLIKRESVLQRLINLIKKRYG